MTFSNFITARISNIKDSDALAFALATGGGPWLSPTAGAAIFGYALFESLPPQMGYLRILASIGAGLAIVVAGAISSHNAIASKDKRLWWLVGGYIVLEIVGLWLMSIPPNVKIVGTVTSLLTLIVYLSRANIVQIDESHADEKEIKAIRLEFQLEQARLNADLERRLKEQKQANAHQAKMTKLTVQQGVKAGVKQSVKSDVKPVSNEAGDFTPNGPEERQQAILDALTVKPDLTKTALALQIGVSRPTLNKDIDALKERGLLNGH